MSDYPVSVALWREKLHVGEARVLDGERQMWGYDPTADAEIWKPVRVVGLKPIKRTVRLSPGNIGRVNGV